MRILLIADGRSPITRNWIAMLSGLKHDLFLVSTFPCEPLEGATLAGVIPVGFANLAGAQVGGRAGKARTGFRSLIGNFRPLLRKARAVVTPWTLGKYQRQLNGLAADIQPDLAHALRIPFEGMLAAALSEETPLILSTWGNDLTLHARSSRGMAARTREALMRADGLMADAARDIGLAADWGWRSSKSCLVVPGSGGLDLKGMQEVIKSREELPFDLSDDRPIVVNPRGFRPGSVHQEIFFRTIPLVLEKVPEAYFVCTAMQGQARAEKWVRDLGIKGHVLLLPYLDQENLWRLFARSMVYVSLSSHDGTPNTFLEALSCGCFPVVGDIASLREWLTAGESGLLVDPRDPQAAADAIIRGLTDAKLRTTAAKKNKIVLEQQAERATIRKQVGRFYQQVSTKK